MNLKLYMHNAENAQNSFLRIFHILRIFHFAALGRHLGVNR